MASITPEMKGIIENTRVFALATATKEGEPNVAAIACVRVLSDDELLIMDNYMLKTRQNIETNPKVAIAAWAGGKGYQFKGRARVETSGKIFEEGAAWVKSRDPNLNSKAAVIVKVDEIYMGTGGPDAGKKIG
jgi:predicted pyridoxine 5'-phosphate oxidase superfamily flavin-nucleotide-binding protein